MVNLTFVGVSQQLRHILFIEAITVTIPWGLAICTIPSMHVNGVLLVMMLMFYFRYSIKCDPGQLLSYSVHSFHLEQEGTCFEQNECLDWVQVGLRNLGNSERFCGIGEVNEIHVDGAEEMTIEFASNRKTETGGFLYFISCVNPGFDQNGINSGTVPSSQSTHFPFSTCIEPVDQSERLTSARVCMFIR